MSQVVRKPIALLPDHLVNKIAAGEVVERPSSVVKELVENAIDAGATRIDITIEDGGRTLIKIADNGSGIPADQAPLAFAQHATSKIQNADDLFAIGTMGFRGEALASIASVCHVTMTTRTADEPQGVRLEVHDSKLSAPRPAAAAVGTIIEARDLFYTVPARRKFLRTDATEFGHVHEMLLRVALPNPQIAFTLSHNGRLVQELPATTDHRVRVAEALGKELHDQLLAVHFEERGITVSGFAGQPALARATAKYQYLFLNRRYIRDRSLFHALKEAYRGLIEPQSQPIAVLLIDIDPAQFDINVHPQKTEVRFRDASNVYRAVLAATRETLLATDLTPQVKTSNRFDGPPPATFAPSRTVDSPSTTHQKIADFFKQATPAAPQPRLSFPAPVGERPTPSPIEDPSRITVRQLPELPKVDPPTESESRHLAPADRTLTTKPETPRFVQLFNTYIVAETPDGHGGGSITIIDQHALHERILYEELFARMSRGPLEGQRLLIPEVLPVTPKQVAALETVKPMLTNLGIEVADFDAHSVAVHTFPSLLSKVSPREFLRDLLDKLLELGSKLTAEELLHELLDMASCKAAVKAGYPLSHDEIAALLERKHQVERSSNCPHGRPTTLRLTISDLERQFKRK